MAEDEIGGMSGPDGEDGVPESLLPYERWIEQAYRGVMIQALQQAAAEGLPGAHHFYVTFRTDDPLTVVPKRLLAQYPQEMTIVLQHQFWDLKIDEEAQLFSVGLSFGSVPTTLVVPLRAITGFADPQVRLALRFTYEAPDAVAPEAVASEPERPFGAVAPFAGNAGREAPGDDVAATEAEDGDEPKPDAAPQVVSLDAFRKRGPSPG